jgi:hypothetical protein
MMAALFLLALVLVALGPASSVEECRRAWRLTESVEDQAITPEEIGPSGCGCWGWGLAAIGLGILYLMIIVMEVDTL